MSRHQLISVHLHFWENGVYRVLENLFDQLEQAMEFAENSYHVDEVKVYDRDGECIHHHKHEHHKDHDHDGYR